MLLYNDVFGLEIDIASLRGCAAETVFGEQYAVENTNHNNSIIVAD